MEIGDGPGLAGQLQDVQPGIGAIDNVDIAAVIDLDVIRLNRHLTGFPTAGDGDTALVGFVSNGRDVEGYLLGAVWVTDVYGPHASVEVGDEHEAPIVDRRKRLVTGVRPEASAACAEVAAGLWYLKIPHRKWLGWSSDVHQEDHLAMLTTLMLNGLIDQDDKVGRVAVLMLGGLWNLYPQDRKCCMGPGVRSDVQPADLRVQEIFGRGCKGVRRGGITLQKF